ncbi:MAG: hypothetical protein HETSPECPRED_006525 [Heterodermia speciosa]|uniref:Sulfatase N-terminal domain-containing protein n=1 Tax=Heterodermia speciosa TaxID=116794 RepID=A0A8H3FQK7_9LECA|nr:MAG: hypothetical protein HETSPECPRED_006525 [Heterodermia speciosa]
MKFLTSAVGLVTFTAALARDPQAPLSESSSASSAKSPQSRPNIVFFLADDQDVHLDSLAYQPAVHRHLIDEGLTFRRHFCTVALCCPSRVNLWTGKAAHNTNVTDINPPYGGYPKFVSQGLNGHYLPIWLQEAGYRTYYTGKLFNAHTVENYNEPFPAGWTGSDFLLDPFTYSYLNSTWQRNTDPPVSHEGDYTTDVISQKAKGFLKDAVETEDPFFLAIAPVAPHSNVEVDHGTQITPDAPFKVTPPIAAERHKDLFKNVQIPRTEHFNPDKASGVSWIRQLPKQSSVQVEYNDEFYRSRLRALQAVDELVDDIFGLLEQHGILDNTYVIYSSDNGYHIGQHRLPPGKECGYEEDVNVPLIVRGPNVPKGITTDQVTSHTDLVPTILELVGAQPKDDLDGTAIPLREAEISRSDGRRHEHVNLEYWGFALAEGKYGFAEEDLSGKLILFVACTCHGHGFLQ